MMPEKEARLRELLGLVARENNPRKREKLALELARLLSEERAQERAAQDRGRRY